MSIKTSRAYSLNEETGNYEITYPLTHMNAVYTKDDESETLGNKLSDIDNTLDDNINKIGVLNTSMENVTAQLSDIVQLNAESFRVMYPNDDDLIAYLFSFNDGKVRKINFPNKTYNLTKTLYINLYYYSVEGNATTFNFSGLTTSIAVNIESANNNNEFKGINITTTITNSDDTVASNKTGVSIGRATGGTTSHFNFVNVGISGFNIGVYLGAHQFFANFTRCKIFNNNIGVWSDFPFANADCGASESFEMTDIYNNNLAIKCTNWISTIFLSKCCLDYNKKNVYATNGKIYFSQCNLENKQGTRLANEYNFYVDCIADASTGQSALSDAIIGFNNCMFLQTKMNDNMFLQPLDVSYFYIGGGATITVSNSTFNRAIAFTGNYLATGTGQYKSINNIYPIIWFMDNPSDRTTSLWAKKLLSPQLNRFANGSFTKPANILLDKVIFPIGNADQTNIYSQNNVDGFSWSIDSNAIHVNKNTIKALPISFLIPIKNIGSNFVIKFDGKCPSTHTGTNWVELSYVRGIDNVSISNTHVTNYNFEDVKLPYLTDPTNVYTEGTSVQLTSSYQTFWLGNTKKVPSWANYVQVNIYFNGNNANDNGDYYFTNFELNELS